MLHKKVNINEAKLVIFLITLPSLHLCVMFILGCIIIHPSFFYKNLVYKNVEAEISVKIKNNIRTLPQLPESQKMDY